MLFEYKLFILAVNAWLLFLYELMHFIFYVYYVYFLTFILENLNLTQVYLIIYKGN